MLRNIYSLKKLKKTLSSALLARNIDSRNVFLVSSISNKKLKSEVKLLRRLVQSNFKNFPPEIFIKNHLVKVENYINCFSSCEKFDSLIRSKIKLSICSVYYKNLISTSCKLFRNNSLFWLLIKIKLISILTFRQKLSSSNG